MRAGALATMMTCAVALLSSPEAAAQRADAPARAAAPQAKAKAESAAATKPEAAATKPEPAAATKPESAAAARAARDLNDKDAAVRRVALLWFADNGVYRQADAIVPMLNDEDDDNRELAEAALWQMWGRTGNARVDRQYQRAVDLMNGGDLKAAVAAFSALIRARPDLAEAWNKRATLYFMLGEVDRSLADCDEVIKRNRFHFGALAGYGQLYSQKGEYETAVEYFNRALEVNPNMRGVRVNIDALQRLIERKRRNTT